MSSVIYYYYTGLLCGGGIQEYFRSTIPNLSDTGQVVRAYCAACGGTEQCFDNISPTFIPNTNDVIEVFESCDCCQGLCPTPTQTSTPESTLTPTPTPSFTPTNTPTNTSTPTSTQTPTQTKTPNRTPTQTPTFTQTPTSTSIQCGSGYTTGNYWYTDCCGNFQQGKEGVEMLVSLNYKLPYQGITLLNQAATTTCLTPTPTQTPTLTPSITQSPTLTQTPTKTPNTTPTPTNTPSNSPVYVPKNECETFTLFDLGVNCEVISQPTSSTSFDGILTLRVTGGTSPYSFYWANGQRTQTLVNLRAGLYPVSVVDYYGDYTANTVCSLFAPTPSVTNTPTVTPTRTPDPIYSNICFLAYNNSSIIGPSTFIQNGTFNNKPRWTNSSNQNIIWKGTRWEYVNSDLQTPVSPQGGGLFGSETTTLPPLADWKLFGGTQTYKINVTQGTCPPTTPLEVNISTQNATCNNQTNCDGSITIQTLFGQPPYEFSLNNGVTWQSSNIFSSLCPGTYNVRVRDSVNNSFNQSVQIGFVGSPQTYQINVITQPEKTVEIRSNGVSSRTTYFIVTSQPPLPQGITLQFNLTTSSTKTYNGPGTGTIVDNFTILNNGIVKVPFNTESNSITNTRPDCNPESQTIVTETDTYYLELSSNSTVSGSTTSVLTITDGQVGLQSNCTTNLSQQISLQITDPTIKGCTCCTVVADTVITRVNSNSITFDGIIEPPTCATCQGIINTGTIYLDMSTSVGGTICTGPMGQGCYQNFRYSQTGGILSDNSGLSSLECGINTNQDVSYMVVFFQTPTSDNYNVSVEILLNGNLVGNGVFSGFCSAQQLNQVYVSMFSPINITAGDIVRIIYNP